LSETEGKGASGWISFDRVEIDLAGRRLFVDAVAMPLEPKAFGVLALLAQHPGRVFTRDEILDAVWGHRHVTPGVLNRIVTLLRHALGETAERTRYLSTVHAVGYRFDAPVRFSAERGSAMAVPAAPATGNAEPGASATTITAIESSAAIVEPSPAPAAALRDPTAPNRVRVSGGPRNAVSSRMWLAAFAAAAVIAAMILWPRTTPVLPKSATTSATAAPTLVVLPCVRLAAPATKPRSPKA
jgi:DNA-binding winged helix-turn-helix (wHTH) protein